MQIPSNLTHDMALPVLDEIRGLRGISAAIASQVTILTEDEIFAVVGDYMSILKDVKEAQERAKEEDPDVVAGDQSDFYFNGSVDAITRQMDTDYIPYVLANVALKIPRRIAERLLEQVIKLAQFYSTQFNAETTD